MQLRDSLEWWNVSRSAAKLGDVFVCVYMHMYTYACIYEDITYILWNLYTQFQYLMKSLLNITFIRPFLLASISTE